MSFKSSFGKWAVRLRTRPSPCCIIISHNGKDRKRTISPKQLDEEGYYRFPAELRDMIQGELTYANQYDKMMDKFYEWYDNEY